MESFHLMNLKGQLSINVVDKKINKNNENDKIYDNHSIRFVIKISCSVLFVSEISNNFISPFHNRPTIYDKENSHKFEVAKSIG